MLIFLYWTLKNLFFPSTLKLLLEPLLLIVIIIVGISMALGCVGIKVERSLTTSIVDNLFKGIGYVVKALLKGLWRLCKCIYLLTPKVFKKVKQFCSRKGATSLVSNLVAGLVTVVLLLIII